MRLSHSLIIASVPELHLAASTNLFLLLLFPLHSNRDPEYQLRGDSAKPALASPSTPRLQALLCVPGQVLRVPLWCQRLWGLQGETPGLPLNLPSKQDICQSYCFHVISTGKKKEKKLFIAHMIKMMNHIILSISHPLFFLFFFFCWL